MPPAAIFLSTAKEIWKRTPPKTNGFWISFRPIATAPQKGPHRITPAPIPAAAPTSLAKVRRPNNIKKLGGPAGRTYTCRRRQVRDLIIAQTVDQHTHRAVHGSGSDKRTARIRLYDEMRRSKSRVIHSCVFRRTPTAQEVLKPAVSSSVFGHFWGCGQK